MKKYTNISKLSDNKFLNLFHINALTDAGRPFDYYFVSRRKEDKLKLYTKDIQAEGIVIYPVLKDEPDKIIMIRQYRYPLDDFIYELPAGLIDSGETPSEAAIREMKEETGMDFQVYEDGNPSYRRPFFMGAGYTDESVNTVFGFASGRVSREHMEDTESIHVLVVDKQEAERILAEEKVSIRAAYLLMQFIHADEKKPFAFLHAD